MLTTHLHLVPRSKNTWNYTSTPPIRLYGMVLSSSTGTPLPYFMISALDPNHVPLQKLGPSKLSIPHLCNWSLCNWTNSRQQTTSWEANGRSATQKIPRLLLNPKVHYHVHNSPPMDPILSNMNPVHNFQLYFPKVPSNITFPSMCRCSKWSLPFRFSQQNFVCISHLAHAHNMPHPSRPPSVDHPNNIWRRMQIINLLLLPPSIYILSLVRETKFHTHIKQQVKLYFCII